MNRKKITKAALSGLVAVAMVPAMAAPLVANAESESKSSIINVVFTDENGNNVGGGDQLVDADGDGIFKATELDLPEGYELNGGGDYFVKDGKFTISVKKTVKSSIVNVVFIDENGNNVGGGDQWVDADGDGIFKATELDLPEGYELNGGGDYFVKDGKFTISVKKTVKSSIVNVVFIDENGNNVGGGDQWVDADGDGIFKATELDLPEGYELNGGGDYFVKDGKFTISVKKINKGTIINFTFVGVNGESLGGGDVIVDKDGDGIFNSSEIASIIPEGYKNDSLLGDFLVSEFEDSSNVIALKKIYNSTIVNIQFIDENGTVVGGGDYFVDEDGDGIFKASELELPVGYKLNGGGDYFVTDPDINIPVTKINKGTIINVVFEDPQGNNLGGGDYVVDVDGDGIANYSELDLPVGYKLNVTGDFFVEEGGHYTVVLNRDGAAIIHVVFKSEGGKNLGGGDYFVDEDGDGIFNYTELTLPEGYELIETGDAFVDTEKTYEITLNKEIEGTIINVVYVDEDGNNLGGGDFFVDPDDDGIANYSELDLPEGYELIVTGDFFVTPGKSYTITLHKITEEETAAATLIVRYVDQENGNEVVLEKTYDDQVGPVGETATYIEDVVVPEGYELVQDIEGIAADVEYGQTKVMYVFVTKTAQEPTQPGDEDKPNTPAEEETTEESEQTDGTNTGVAMSLAGVFGTMSAALAGMVALLRRKQK